MLQLVFTVSIILLLLAIAAVILSVAYAVCKKAQANPQGLSELTADFNGLKSRVAVRWDHRPVGEIPSAGEPDRSQFRLVRGGESA